MNVAPVTELFLFDTNAIIEAVRTGIWNAITGDLQIETVEEVRKECLREPGDSTGYVPVTRDALARMSAMHPVSKSMRATLAVLEGAAALDPGERDLFAFISSPEIGEVWWVCSPDKASIRFTKTHKLLDNMISLEHVAGRVEARPSPTLRKQFTEAWLSERRTEALLGSL